MLKQRVITAIILVVLLGGVLFGLPYQAFVAVMGLVFAAAAWEWSNLAGLAGTSARLGYLSLFVVLQLLIALFLPLWAEAPLPVDNLQHVLGIGCTWWAVALLWIKGYPASAALWGNVVVRCVMGLLVLLPCWVALSYLRQLAHGEWLILYVFAVVAGADTGAYFVGRALGKAKLAPDVSPGKSWAGFWGGLVTTGVIALVIGALYSVAGLSYVALVVVSVITALASVLGDLQESMVKRHRGVKDSSQLLPGHGGVLDRLDSMSAAAPVFSLLLILLSN